MVALVDGKGPALPVYRRAAPGSIDEVLVLEVGHCVAVEAKGLDLRVVLGVFVILP